MKTIKLTDMLLAKILKSLGASDCCPCDYGLKDDECIGNCENCFAKALDVKPA